MVMNVHAPVIQCSKNKPNFIGKTRLKGMPIKYLNK